MGCGSSTNPVATEAGKDPIQAENFKEGTIQEKHVSSKPLEKVEDNATFNQTEDLKSGDFFEKEKEDKGKVPAARIDMSTEAITISSTQEQVHKSTACEGYCNTRNQDGENVMEVRDVADVQNNSRESLLGKAGDSVMGEVRKETTVSIPGRAATVIQANASLSSSRELVEKETCKVNENPVGKDAQIDIEIKSPTESRGRVENGSKDKEITIPSGGRDRINVQNESRDFVTEEGEGIRDDTETVIQVTAEFSSEEIGEKENSNVENPQEKHNHIDTEITLSNQSTALDNEIQKFPDSPVNAFCDCTRDPSCADSDLALNKESEIRIMQDHGQDSQTYCVASFPAVQNQSNSSLVQGKEPDEIALEQTSIENMPEKESEKSIDVHENTFSETTLPGSGRKISSDSIVVESLSAVDQNKNSESALSCTAFEQEASNLSTVNEECTTVSSAGGDQKKEEPNSLLLEGSIVDVVTVQSSETAKLDSVEDVSPSRNIDTENRLVTALRLSCKLSPGNPVEDLDTSGVMSLHLMRSLSPGKVSAAELVKKLDNLTELDLSGNLLGPQGFRVICLALSRNATLRKLNLANNLADTDSSVSMHSAILCHLCDCIYYLLQFDLSELSIV